MDIKAVATQVPADGQRAVRPRGTSKLLSRSGNVGLALMRMDHIRMVERGEGDLRGQSPDDETSLAVVHWRPRWWPDAIGRTE